MDKKSRLLSVGKVCPKTRQFYLKQGTQQRYHQTSDYYSDEYFTSNKESGIIQQDDEQALFRDIISLNGDAALISLR